MSETLNCHSVSEYMVDLSGRGKKKEKSRRNVVIMDEVDGMSGGVLCLIFNLILLGPWRKCGIDPAHQENESSNNLYLQ